MCMHIHRERDRKRYIDIVLVGLGQNIELSANVHHLRIGGE